MQSERIISLSQFISSIEKLQRTYHTLDETNNPAASHFLYRGMSQEVHALIPGVFRRQDDNDIYLSWATERDFLLSFIHEAVGLVEIPPEDLGHWAEYAQHYGVPTRFLDWTSNPLTALYFACRSNRACHGSLWLLHSTNYKRLFGQHTDVLDNLKIRDTVRDLINGTSDVEYPILYTPHYMDTRMSAQGSYFMAWGTRTGPLETMLSEDRYQMAAADAMNGRRLDKEELENALLFKFTIFSEDKPSILRELDMVGINEKSLFPGLDGIGRYVESKYRFDHTEAERYFIEFE